MRACSTRSRSASSTRLPYSASCAAQSGREGGAAGGEAARQRARSSARTRASARVGQECMHTEHMQMQKPLPKAREQKRSACCNALCCAACHAPAWLYQRPGSTCTPPNTPASRGRERCEAHRGCVRPLGASRAKPPRLAAALDGVQAAKRDVALVAQAEAYHVQHGAALVAKPAADGADSRSDGDLQ